MTEQNRNIPPRIKRDILERDNNRCVKCGRVKILELHHIIPAYLGGVEQSWNLISLCHSCHKEAPDDPIEFFKWASTSLPPKLDECLKLTKICVGLLSYHPELMSTLNNLKDYKGDMRDFETNKVFSWIDSFYKDLWKVYVSNDLSNMTIFFEEYITKPKDNTKLYSKEQINSMGEQA